MSSDAFVIRNDAVFLENGVNGVAGHPFCAKNLIIGKNGSGKTRFLKALEKYYSQAESTKQVITLYFPEIRPTYVPSEPDEAENGVSLSDVTYSDSSLSFQDFLKLVERDGVSFLEDIYTGLNVRAKGTKQKRLQDFQKLNNFLLQLLGRSLLEEKDDGRIIMAQSSPSDWAMEKNGDVHIYGPGGRALALEDCLKELSPGELMLFYLSTFLFYLGHVSGEDRKVVLLMDEPELHLHPKALLAMLGMIESCDMIDQLWIATHSVFILPQFSFEDLVYMHESEVLKLNSTTYRRVYDDLVGLDNIDMYELLCSIENWENYQFVVENFLLPQTKGNANKKDEQALKVLKTLKQIQAERPLRVLDYGAGQCRLWECLKLAIPDKIKRDQMLDYKAYDAYPSKERPKEVTYYTAKGEVEDAGEYDAVILMNVLHEIEPKEWCDVFSTIHSFLNEDGILIFLEVLSLTNGEQPYGQAGFLLLRDKQVKELFPHSHSEKLPNSRKAEKSNCWVIPADDLQGVQDMQVRRAVESLEKECEELLVKMDRERIAIAPKKLEEIPMEVRKQKAHQYAFVSQQFINARLARQRIWGLSGKAHSASGDMELGETEKILYRGLVKNLGTP